MNNYLFVLVFFALGCGGHTVSDQTISLDSGITNDYVDFLKVQERKSAQKSYAHLGQIVSKISFEILDTSSSTGVRNWVYLSKVETEIADMLLGNQPVVSQDSVTLVIDYPLQSEYSFEFVSSTGFTRKQLVKMIAQQYYKIYEVEEKSATTKTVPLAERKEVYNRNLTNGRFGIWGHDLSDLVLVEIRIHRSVDNRTILSLGIES